MNLFATSPEIGIDPTVAGSIVGTYWFLMMIGRLFGASFGAKISSKAMLSISRHGRYDLYLDRYLRPCYDKS